MSESLDELLVRHRDELVAFLEREASGLLRYEAAEDLAQGVHLRALEGAAAFTYRGEKEFFAWLYTVARRHVADRHAYWSALKRGSGKVLRLSWSRTGTQGGDATPAGSTTGPSGFAAKREMLALAAQALAVLPARDRDLVRWASEDVDLNEQARRLEISYAAVQRAGLRALDRFRKAFELVQRRASER